MIRQADSRRTHSNRWYLARACAVLAITLIIDGCQWPPPENWGWGPKKEEQRIGEVPPNPALGDEDRPEPKVTMVSDKERSDIVQVATFVPTNPWLVFDPLDGRIDGFKCTVYLGALLKNQPDGKKDGIKGFFGDGTIIVQLFQDATKPGERTKMTLAHSWELSPDDAYPWRAREMSLLGWGYGLRLQWPKELDLSGKNIAILVSYRRTDGRLISSSKPIERHVPIRGV